MSENRIFPAVFHEEDGQYWVEFPDIPGCFSSGRTIEEAYRKSEEALALALDGEENSTEATPLKDINVDGNDRVLLVQAGSADNIVYINNTVVPRKIEEGLSKRNLTKYQVAQILGVNRSYITRISAGERIPSVDMAKRIGILLDFDWRVLFSESKA